MFYVIPEAPLAIFLLFDAFFFLLLQLGIYFYLVSKSLIQSSSSLNLLLIPFSVSFMSDMSFLISVWFMSMAFNSLFILLWFALMFLKHLYNHCSELYVL